YNCFEEQQNIRIETITLSDFKTVTFEKKEVEFQKENTKKILKRYKVKESSFKVEDDLIEYAKICNQIAKKVLVKDKSHRQMFMLHSPLAKWEVIDAEVQDKTSKFILMSELSSLVKKKGIDALIHISEAW